MKHSISTPIDISNLFDYIREINIDTVKEPYPTYSKLLKEDMSYNAIGNTLDALLSEIPQDKKQIVKNFIVGKI